MFEYYAFYLLMFLVAIIFILMDFFLDVEIEIFYKARKPTWNTILFVLVWEALHFLVYAFIVYKLSLAVILSFKWLIAIVTPYIW